MLQTTEFETFDVLGFWKAKETMFPVLSRMAMDILSVQATSVASESAFSTSGRVLSIRRTRLTPASLEMCMCLKDHLDAQERKQDKSTLETPVDFEEEILDAEVQANEAIPLSDEEIALDVASNATKRQRTSAPTSELGQYMATNFLITLRPEEFTNFDILAWWKEREIQFPILSAMARDLLTVQASTVASESAFSISGRIISERRSRLTPESVEVCVCLKDYLDGVDRVQHETSLEGPILEDVEETIAREEVDLGISPPNTELDEGEFEDLDIEHVDVEDFLEDLMD
ncbi:zinc finger BED domain-containing protein RICESLEEPER 2 [Tanacetum coccineum]